MGGDDAGGVCGFGAVGRAGNNAARADLFAIERGRFLSQRNPLVVQGEKVGENLPLAWRETGITAAFAVNPYLSAAAFSGGRKTGSTEEAMPSSLVKRMFCILFGQAAGGRLKAVADMAEQCFQTA